MQCPKCKYEPTLTELQGDADRCPKCQASFDDTPPRQSSALVKGLRGARAAVKAGRQARAEKFYCPHCGSLTPGKMKAPGSIGVELILWLIFLLPGIIYSVWRICSKKQVCTECAEPGLIAATSPRAKRDLDRS